MAVSFKIDRRTLLPINIQFFCKNFNGLGGKHACGPRAKTKALARCTDCIFLAKVGTACTRTVLFLQHFDNRA